MNDFQYQLELDWKQRKIDALESDLKGLDKARDLEIARMHAEYEALRHIHLTAAKATPDTYAHAIGWIEVKSNHILEETAEPLTPDESAEPEMCDCGNAPVMPGYRVCESCKFARDTYPWLHEGEAPDKLGDAS